MAATLPTRCTLDPLVRPLAPRLCAVRTLALTPILLVSRALKATFRGKESEKRSLAEGIPRAPLTEKASPLPTGR